jgi:hypothetical protein
MQLTRNSESNFSSINVSKQKFPFEKFPFGGDAWPKNMAPPPVRVN